MPEFTVPPVLPFDIIGNIIDILFNDVEGPQYVKDFSLVCHSFLPLCRKHIFSCITINICGRPSKQISNGEVFGQLLLKNPCIARYVRKLTIYIVQREFESNGFLELVPPQLTRLQSLSIAYGNNVDWHDFSSSIRHLLLNFMRLPTVTYVDLREILSFPTSDLVVCTNVKHLSVCGFEILDDEASSSPLCRKSMKLRTLDISIRTSKSLVLLEATYSDGRPVLDLTDLETVSIVLEEAVQIKGISKKIPRLRDASISASYFNLRDLEFAKTITESLQTLRRVKFAVWFEDGDPLGAVCDELEEISGRNKLECIEIDVRVRYQYKTHDEWHRLEEVLITSGWPELKCVSITITSERVYSGARGLRPPTPFELALKNLEHTHFPRLRRSKHLDLKFLVKGTIY